MNILVSALNLHAILAIACTYLDHVGHNILKHAARSQTPRCSIVRFLNDCYRAADEDHSESIVHLTPFRIARINAAECPECGSSARRPAGYTRHTSRYDQCSDEDGARVTSAVERLFLRASGEDAADHLPIVLLQPRSGLTGVRLV